MENNLFHYFKAIYKPNENNKEKVRILGKEFIEKNKFICKIIYKHKSFELKEYIEDIDKNYNHKDTFHIILIFGNLKDMSYFFNMCDSLISLEEISVSVGNEKESLYFSNNNDKFNQSFDSEINIIDNANNEIKFKSNLTHSRGNQITVMSITNMSHMFNGCKSLILLDISHWLVSNVNNMSNMFNGCESLISLPDISNWYINNVNDISNIFKECKSLKSLPDISKWYTSKVMDMSHMFEGCKSLKS